MFLDVLTKAIQNSVETMKTFFVGDLNYQDLQDVMRREVPKSFVENRLRYPQGFVSEKEFNTRNIIVRQYGLIGWLFNLNMAVIRATDTDASKALLHTIDNMPNARRPFSLLEMVPQVTTLPSMVGEHGLQLHKDFVRIMPSSAFMIEKSILLTKMMIETWTTESDYTLILCDADCNHHEAKFDEIHISSTGDISMYDKNNEWKKIGSLGQAPDPEWVNNPERVPEFKKIILNSAKEQNVIHRVIKEQEDIFSKLPSQALNKLTQSIVISLMIDDRMIKETLTLIEIMKNVEGDSDRKQKYNALLKNIIQHCITNNKHQNTQTALHKAINTAKTDDVNELAQNPLICSIFSSLAALENVENALISAASLYSSYPEVRGRLMDEIKSQGLSFQTDDVDGRDLLQKIISSQSLDCFFKDALRTIRFQPRTLPRYLATPLSYDGVTIPGGTHVFIMHRSNEHDRKYAHQHSPLFTMNQSAPKLRTTDAAAFSYGNRSCPGNKLTEYVTKTVIAVLVDFMAKANEKLCQQADDRADCKTTLKMG